jgi:hypothetical protein
MNIKRDHQSGQIMVLYVLALVGLFGFAALALDGGMIYWERRRAQNAADTGALAAALAKIKAQNLHVVALDRVSSNGFSTTWGPCDPAGSDCTLGTGTDWTVQVSNPPRSGEYSGDSDYIQVIITTEVGTSFAHLVFTGPLRTTVEAVSRVWSEQSITPGHAMFATTKHDCKGVWFSGTGDTVITGGNVFSNSDASSVSCQSGVQGGAGNITVGPNPHYGIKLVGTFDQGGSGIVDSTIDEGVMQEINRTVPKPDCSGLPDNGKLKINAGATETIQPGSYEEITILGGATVTMESGMYCIYGSKGFSANGGSITGAGIMIYLEQGPFDPGGNTLVDLTAELASDMNVDPSYNDWEGMLIYVDSNNTSATSLSGTSNTQYTGTIYAPSSECTLNGTGDSIGYLSSQIICDKVKVTGTALVSIDHNESEIYHLPPAIDLVK